MAKILDFNIYNFGERINEAMDEKIKRKLIADLKIYCEESGADYGEVCKLLKITSSGLEKLSNEAIVFLNEFCGEGNWEFNKDTGKIDADCSSYSTYRNPMNGNLSRYEQFPEGIEFGDYQGSFNVSNSSMKSFKGFPKKVTGNLNISNCKYSSLEGCPQEVGGEFQCDSQKGETSLVNLEGGPQKVAGGYSCKNNSLTSLVGAPEKVSSYFDCSSNKLESLVGGPEEVGGEYRCANNELNTLRGFAKKCTAVDAENNDLYSLEGVPLSGYMRISCKRNLYPESVLKETYGKAQLYESWTASYLWLVTTERFQRMSKLQRDPIREELSPENIKSKSITLGKIWKSSLVDDPAVKRILKRANVDQEFKDEADLGADLSDIGF